MSSRDDESSRDSGIYEMEEGASTNFSGLTSGNDVEKCIEEQTEHFRSLTPKEEEVIVSQKRYSITFRGFHGHVLHRFPMIPGLSPSSVYRRISVETLREVLHNLDPKEFQNTFLLIDCRYPYEYEGGHIKNAINVWDRKEVQAFFFESQRKETKMRIPIFYCEFSQKRGPAMAKALREADRKRNVAIYPHCSYEEMYVLDKGYRRFYNFAKEEKLDVSFCEPSDYVPMDHDDYLDELRKYNNHKKANGSRSVVSHTSEPNCLSDCSPTSVRQVQSPPEQLKEFGSSVSKETVPEATLKEPTATSGGLRFRTNRQTHKLFESPPRKPEVHPSPSSSTPEVQVSRMELSP